MKQMEIKQIAAAKLKPFAGNPRVITEAELEKLKRSLQQFGFVEPIVARAEDEMVIGGHQRLAAALALGWAEVPVIFLKGLSDNDATLLNLALNRISGDWDEVKLGELLDELQSADDVDELLSGFDENEITELLYDLNPDEFRVDNQFTPVGPDSIETIEYQFGLIKGQVTPGVSEEFLKLYYEVMEAKEFLLMDDFVNWLVKVITDRGVLVNE